MTLAEALHPMTDNAGRLRSYVEGINRGDVSAADAVCAHDCVVHITGRAEPIVGLASYREHAAAILVAFPDVHFTIEELLTIDDIVVMRWHARGTHRGPFGPIPATGKPVSIFGLIIDHFVEGRISVRWEQYDQALLLQQIGM